ncbi:MAG: GDSL-type esterase/lipase family protein [Parachlamydiaceae bacterium]|nr:GDSL-type esterase/lipase family protein [Parachlamydiaceae bacterium]
MKNFFYSSIIFVIIILGFPLNAFASYKIVFIGDSITQGYIDLSHGYVYLMEKRLLEEGYDVEIINYGISGTETSLHRKILLDALPIDQPDLVVINSGIVDSLLVRNLIDIRDNLAAMIENSLKYKAKIILGLIDISWKHWTQPVYYNYNMSFLEIYKSLASEYNIQSFPFLDVVTLKSPEYNMGDSVHPNKKGHQRICDLLYPEIVKNLPKNETILNNQETELNDKVEMDNNLELFSIKSL